MARDYKSEYKNYHSKSEQKKKIEPLEMVQDE